MSPLKLCLIVALVFGAIALAMLVAPRLRKRRDKRKRRWNNTRPKHDLSPREAEERSRD